MNLSDRRVRGRFGYRKRRCACPSRGLPLWAARGTAPTLGLCWPTSLPRETAPGPNQKEGQEGILEERGHRHTISSWTRLLFLSYGRNLHSPACPWILLLTCETNQRPLTLPKGQLMSHFVTHSSFTGDEKKPWSYPQDPRAHGAQGDAENRVRKCPLRAETGCTCLACLLFPTLETAGETQMQGP